MKKLAFLAAMALSTSALAGCATAVSSSTTSTASSSSSVQPPSTLIIYSDFAREVVDKEIYRREIFDAFEKANNVKINFVTFAQAQDTFNKVDTEQKAQLFTGDLIISHYGTMTNYITPGYMQDVSTLETQMNDRTFLSSFDGPTKVGSARYFFPINSDVYLSYANKEAFNTLPTGLTKENILAGNYTWEDYSRWATAIGGTRVFGKGRPNAQLLYQIGGMALSNGGTFPNLNDAGNLKAWQDIISMKNFIHPDSLTALLSGELMSNDAAYLAFDLLIPVAAAVAAAPAKYEVFPGPKGTTGKSGSIAGGHGIGLLKNSPNEAMAREFIKWMTAPDQIVHASLGTIPPLAEATNALGNEPSDIVIKKGIATLGNANIEGLQMISQYTDWGALKGTYDRMFVGIMNGTITNANLQAKLDEEQAIMLSLRR